MKQTLPFFLTLLMSCSLFAQTTATFEEYNLNAGEFLNGSDGSGGFSSENVWLPNLYNDSWGSWTGWAFSSMTDTQTPGFMNQYSASTGEGENGSLTYAVTYVAGTSTLLLDEKSQVNGLFITNGTYAYLSMLEGDGFAKKFGGEDGTDPDYFKLTIKGFEDGQLKPDSVDFYLADYRFEDPSMDYLVSDWEFVDLTELGAVDSLQFSLESSDVGIFGMNTPAYFCIDNVVTSPLSFSTEQENLQKVSVFPNPATDILFLDNPENENFTGFVFDQQGRICLHQSFFQGRQSIHIQDLPAGSYTLLLINDHGSTVKRFVRL